MSHVTSAVIVVSYAPEEVEPLLTERQSFGRVAGMEQGFARIDTSHCGGGKFLQQDIYAAGLNDISSEKLKEWFLGLPWGDDGQAVLIYDDEGDNRTVVCTPGWTADDHR